MRAPGEKVAVVVYRILLRLLSRAFRREHGEESVALFRRTLRDGWSGRGVRGLARAAWVGWTGVLRGAAEEVGAALKRRLRLRRNRRPRRRPSLGSPWSQATRTLSRHPALVAGVVGLLALGIGATVTVLSVVDGVLLRTLPYPEPDRIAVVTDGAHAWPDYRDWSETVSAFATLTAATGMTFTLEEEHRTELEGAQVSDGFLSLFGATVALGRLPTHDELRSGRRVSVVSHAAWVRRWGRDPGLVGRTLRVDGEPVEVVGVLAPDWVPPEAVVGRGVDFIVPVDPSNPELDRQNRSYAVARRLAEGATLERARDELRARAEAYAREFPEQYADDAGGPQRGFEPVPLREATTGDVDSPLFILLGGAALLLLVACANAATLLLARATARRGELAVRRALGGGRGSVLAQLLAESALLSGAAGAAGLAAAHGGIRLLRALEPGDLPRLDAVSVDLRMAVAATGVALLAGLLAGAVPAWRAASTAPVTGLRRGGDGTDGRTSASSSRGLVAAEAALAALLLVGSLAVVQGFGELVAVDPGIRPGGVVTLSVDVGRDAPEEERATAADAIRARLVALPGVEAVGAGLSVPYEVSGGNRCCWLGELTMDQGLLDRAWVHPVTPGYFESLGATFAQGRPFDESEAREGPLSTVLNEAAARELAPGADIVGRTVRFGEIALRVVGVVNAIRHWGSDQPAEPEFYIPYGRRGTWASGLTFAVRGTTVPDADRLRSAAVEAVPRAIVSEVRPMTGIMSASLARQRYYALVLGVFAGSALLLAAAGLAGTLLYDVRRRRHELGIRMALGAPAEQLVRRTVAAGVVTVAVGAALGLLAYWRLSRHLEALLPGMDPAHPGVLLAFAGVLAASALLASWIPARLAAGTDPASVLR